MPERAVQWVCCSVCGWMDGWMVAGHPIECEWIDESLANHDRLDSATPSYGSAARLPCVCVCCCASHDDDDDDDDPDAVRSQPKLLLLLARPLHSLNWNGGNQRNDARPDTLPCAHTHTPTLTHTNTIQFARSRRSPFSAPRRCARLETSVSIDLSIEYRGSRVYSRKKGEDGERKGKKYLDRTIASSDRE